MESSESGPSSGPFAAPDRGTEQPSASHNQPSKHREHPPKSPRRRHKGTRSQQRGVGHEQLLWESERLRLPGQQEHLEPSGSASDTAESSPKRFALQVASWSAVPLPQLCCPGRELLTCPHFFPPSSQESPLSTWTVSSHSLRTQSLYSSQPNFSHVSMRVELCIVFTLIEIAVIGWLTEHKTDASFHLV